MRVAIEQKLVCDLLGQEVEKLFGVFSEVVVDESFELLGVGAVDACHYFVDLRDEGVHLGNKLNQAFGNQHNTIVLTFF